MYRKSEIWTPEIRTYKLPIIRSQYIIKCIKHFENQSIWELDTCLFITLTEYSSHLKTRLVWYSNGIFVSGCQMVWYLNGGLKTGLKKACLWSKMSDIQIVRQVMWLYHLNTGHPYYLVFRCGRYSDGYCTWEVLFANPKCSNLYANPKCSNLFLWAHFDSWCHAK